MKLKVNCKLDAKVQKTITPLLHFKNINISSGAERPYGEITNQIYSEIYNFLEKSFLIE